MRLPKTAKATIPLAALACLGLWLVGSMPRARVVASGRFHQVAHKGAGLATIYQLPDGRLVLRLTEFRTGGGRGLQVYLIAAPDAYENEVVESSEPISVGELQKTEGDQSYLLPRDLDLNKYRAVTIWNRRHGVNFTTAPLRPH